MQVLVSRDLGVLPILHIFQFLSRPPPHSLAGHAHSLTHSCCETEDERKKRRRDEVRRRVEEDTVAEGAERTDGH